MVRSEFEIPSADGRTQLHAVSWSPETPLRGVVQVSHGLGEHVLRYEPLAEYLASHGFATVGHDHLGHGTSIPPDGVRLWFGPKGSWNWLLEDLYAVRRVAETNFGANIEPVPDKIPCFLLGHSMGSFLARSFLIRYPGSVDGAILTGTGQSSTALLRFGYLLTREEEWRLGETSVSSLSVSLAFGSYNRPFEPVRTPYDWMSADEENIDVFLSSPLCGGSPTIGLLREMLSALLEIGDPAQIRKMNPDTPLLLLSGDADPVGDMGKGVRKVERLFRRAGMRDVTCALYPGLRHEILNEKPRYAIYADILHWMQSRMGTP